MGVNNIRYHEEVIEESMKNPILLLTTTLLLSSVTSAWVILPLPAAFSTLFRPWQKEEYDYDLVVIGAGASGLFAAGTASSLGVKTLLVEQAHVDESYAEPRVEFTVGGDCTNAACVPSKAVRSIAKIAAASCDGISLNQDDVHDRKNTTWLQLARQQANDAVGKVRAREDPSRIGDVPNLDLEFVKQCHFVSSHKLRLLSYDNSTWLQGQQMTSADDCNIKERVISSKKFLIATGASPILPGNLTKAANKAGVPYLTYRSLLQPSSHESLLNASMKNIAIVGGGAAACELGQSLSRLCGTDVDISIVAPKILPNDDVSVQQAAIKILANDNCNLHLGCRAVDVVRNGSKPYLVMDNNSSIPVDCILLCTGRSPHSSLKSLHLDNAGIDWTEKGVTVDSYLRSKTARHVYASGDCASAVNADDRRAIHAGWTGFSAVRNALLPFFLRSHATHEFVPRVTYLDPELGSAGLSTMECMRRYGSDGYDSLLVPECGSDRADVESRERSTDANFVEVRSEKISGRILGASACGPAAAEIINEVCLALVNRLTVRDIARTLHSYPSHGYLLYRISMALATQKISGLLAGCGKFGRLLGALLCALAKWRQVFKFGWLPWKRQAMRKLHSWQAAGSSKALVAQTPDGTLSLLSFLDAYGNETLCTQMLSSDDSSIGIKHGRSDFIEWVGTRDST